MECNCLNGNVIHRQIKGRRKREDEGMTIVDDIEERHSYERMKRDAWSR